MDNEKKLDQLISDALKKMIEGPVPIDVEKMWEDFLRRINSE